MNTLVRLSLGHQETRAIQKVILIKDGEEIDEPIDSVSGGMIDVASFCRPSRVHLPKGFSENIDSTR